MTNTSDAQTDANRRSMIETFEAWRDGAEPFPDTWARCATARSST
jgi:hypothetical protein